jgi:dTMP kinase
MKKGKFIIIDGTDGSGKATQTKLLVEKLRKEGFKVAMADFPQYGTKSAGLVEEYLNGKYGKPDEVGPYRASIFYACDRYDSSFKIRKWLNEGKIVISNRYVASNLGHQGGKIKNPAERKKYFQWLYDLEYGIFKIPKPDLNIILHVDAGVAQKLVDKKKKRKYIKGKKRDAHEKDLKHLQNAEKVFIEVAKSFPKFVLIECDYKGNIMPKEKINMLIWKGVKKVIK